MNRHNWSACCLSCNTLTWCGANLDIHAVPCLENYPPFVPTFDIPFTAVTPSDAAGRNHRTEDSTAQDTSPSPHIIINPISSIWLELWWWWLLLHNSSAILYRALICYLHNPKIFFLEIPQGPLGISIGNIRSAQKAFRVPQSSVFCHFPCFIEISPKNGICS